MDHEKHDDEKKKSYDAEHLVGEVSINPTYFFTKEKVGVEYFNWYKQEIVQIFHKTAANPCKLTLKYVISDGHWQIDRQTHR